MIKKINTTFHISVEPKHVDSTPLSLSLSIWQDHYITYHQTPCSPSQSFLTFNTEQIDCLLLTFKWNKDVFGSERGYTRGSQVIRRWTKNWCTSPIMINKVARMYIKIIGWKVIINLSIKIPHVFFAKERDL